MKELEIRTGLARQKGDGPNSGISLVHSKLGTAHTRIERMRESLDQLRLALDIDRELAARQPDDMTMLRRVCVDYAMMGSLPWSRWENRWPRPAKLSAS